MSNKHTPTPWKYVIESKYVHDIVGNGPPNIEYSDGPKKSACLIASMYGGHKQNVLEANAKFLCLAANYHDELVEACKYTMDLLGSGVGQHSHALALIEDILAKIKKEQK